MRRYIITIVVLVALVLIGNNYYQTKRNKAEKAVNTQPVISQPGISATTPEKKLAEIRLAVINIGGFDCPSCPVIAENALKDIRGVIDVRTTASGEGSRVLYDASTVTIDDFRKTLGEMYTIDKVISDEPSQKNKLD